MSKELTINDIIESICLVIIGLIFLIIGITFKDIGLETTGTGLSSFGTILYLVKYFNQPIDKNKSEVTK